MFCVSVRDVARVRHHFDAWRTPSGPQVDNVDFPFGKGRNFVTFQPRCACTNIWELVTNGEWFQISRRLRSCGGNQRGDCKKASKDEKGTRHFVLHRKRLGVTFDLFQVL